MQKWNGLEPQTLRKWVSAPLAVPVRFSSKFRSKLFLVFIQSQNYQQVDNSFKTEDKIIDQCFFIEAKVCLKLNIKENYSMEFSNGFGKKHGESFVLFKKHREKFPIEMEQPWKLIWKDF